MSPEISDLTSSDILLGHQSETLLEMEEIYRNNSEFFITYLQKKKVCFRGQPN
jgi:hypothetical protein